MWEEYLSTLEVRREEDYVLPPSAMDTFSRLPHENAFLLSVVS